MLPKEELFQHFENVTTFWHCRKKITLEWKLSYGRLFFRPQGARVELLWFSPRPFRKTPGSNGERIDMSLDNLYRSHSHFIRRLVLFENAGSTGEVWMVIGPTFCGVSLLDRWVITEWNIQFDYASNSSMFLSAPEEFFAETATRAIKNHPEVWQQTLQWMQLDFDERFWACVSWKVGNKEEWKILIRSLFQLTLSQLPMTRIRSWPIFQFYKPRFTFAPLRMSYGPHQKEFPQAVWKLLRLSEQYFGAKVDYSGIIENSKSPFSWHFSPHLIKAEPPTHHELMEALDLWREFGRKSGQLPEVEACLHQLMM